MRNNKITKRKVVLSAFFQGFLCLSGSKLGVSWEEVEKLIVALQHPMLLNDLKELYGWNNSSKFKGKYINPLIAEGLVDMTVPNKPTSPNQKYYLTEKGMGLLTNETGVKQAESVSEERVDKLERKESEINKIAKL